MHNKPKYLKPSFVGITLFMRPLNLDTVLHYCTNKCHQYFKIPLPTTFYDYRDNKITLQCDVW